MDYNPFDLTQEAEAKAAQEQADKLLRVDEIDDFKWLVSDKRGRRFLWRLLGKTGLFDTAFRPGEESQYCNGMRNIGNIFWTELQSLAPEKYHLMATENKEQKEYVKRVRNARSQG